MTLRMLEKQLLDSPKGDVQRFCDEFCHGVSTPKYILGRNIYAESVAKHVNVRGFVDDYTHDAVYLGRPVVKLSDVPAGAMVLNVAGGRPLSAQRKLNEAGLWNLDYFAFYRLSGLRLVPMRFNEGFQEEFSANESEYEWAYETLSDDESKVTFTKLVNFRFDYDISHLKGFTQREDAQYFEEFLRLRAEGETFVDVGAYDGYTSLEFIRRCPGYRAVHAFEPDPDNYAVCATALREYPNVNCYPIGLSRAKGTLRFSVQGSRSKVSDSGTVTIEVDRLDDILRAAPTDPTFLKMDIEGEESAAIEGAKETISAHNPRLAIAVYHFPGDFWRIPRQILSIRDNYEIYMRHYTECIYETVMFFIPRS